MRPEYNKKGFSHKPEANLKRGSSYAKTCFMEAIFPTTGRVNNFLDSGGIKRRRYSLNKRSFIHEKEKFRTIFTSTDSSFVC